MSNELRPGQEPAPAAPVSAAPQPAQPARPAQMPGPPALSAADRARLAARFASNWAHEQELVTAVERFS